MLPLSVLEVGASSIHRVTVTGFFSFALSASALFHWRVNRCDHDINMVKGVWREQDWRKKQRKKEKAEKMTANELQKKMNELHYLFSKSQYSTLFFVCLVSKVINLIRHFSNRSKHLCVCFYLCSPPCKMLISAEKEEHFSVLYKQSQMKNISENVRKEIRCNSGPKQFIIFP